MKNAHQDPLKVMKLAETLQDRTYKEMIYNSGDTMITSLCNKE